MIAIHRPGDRLAVVDMGTNVFGLAVGTLSQTGSPHWIHRAELEVGLASEGFGFLTEAGQKRAEAALQLHLQIALDHEATALYGFGTEALRQWDQAPEWLQRTASTLHRNIPHKRRIPIKLSVIPGDLEAEWIRYGLQQSGLLEDGPVLINDIGGGSVELVLCHGPKTYLALSLPLGMRKLLHQFPIRNMPQDPQDAPALASKAASYQVAFQQCYEFLLQEFQEHLGQALSQTQALRILGTAGPYRTLDQWNRAYHFEKNLASALISRDQCAAFGDAATMRLQGIYPPLHPLPTDAVVHASALMLALSDACGGIPIQTTELSMREGALLALFHQD
jgi:exopolyphosphatase/pppGpp-phosphohydrolase